MIAATKSAAWMSDAPCVGVRAYIPDASLMREAEKLHQAADPLMRRCVELCPVLEQCHDRVRPAESRFDGVCAARLWVDGRAVKTAKGAPPLPKLPSRAGSCGSSSGVAGHHRQGEPLCAACQETAQRAAVRKAGAATIRTRKQRRKPLALAS
ncbi:hypothetical protein ACFYVL_17210 [Streptomyces sp. NPDC004111]|uniref:hypothetical protein n=1 Tax=Streptomyces sp. NPDC004111 TaxID=3364690 RepID=UPI0036831E82